MECFVNKASMYILCYVDILVVVNFFQSRLRSESVRAIFLLILCLCLCGIIYTRFHASVLCSSMVFVWWKKTGESNFFNHTSRRRVSYTTACCRVSGAANNISELQKNAIFKANGYITDLLLASEASLVANPEYAILF